jgi:purine-nucleoside phosphorylase
MSESSNNYRAAVDAIRQYTQATPRIGLVLGSGLGVLAEELTDAVAIPYEVIPGWPRSTVHGHSGRLVIGELEGHTVVCQQGRAHYYEGYSAEEVSYPIRVMRFLGVETVILTNAAGGVNVDYQAGDIMLINDHINFVGMAGAHALRGENDDSLGPRFVGLGNAYDRDLRAIAKQVAASQSIPMHEGVYTCLSGPTFESPAEVRMMRIIGTDAVGMSTVHEVVVARHMNLRVLAFSAITNKSIDSIDSETDANHEEVLEVGTLIVPKLKAIIRGVVAAL